MPALPEGRVLPVRRAPDAVLGTPGADVDPTGPESVQLAADLLATQRVSPGCVGLAAQQVGLAVRMFSVDVTGHPKTRTCHGAFVLCHAAAVSATGEEWLGADGVSVLRKPQEFLSLICKRQQY